MLISCELFGAPTLELGNWSSFWGHKTMEDEIVIMRCCSVYNIPLSCVFHSSATVVDAHLVSCQKIDFPWLMFDWLTSSR